MIMIMKGILLKKFLVNFGLVISLIISILKYNNHFYFIQINLIFIKMKFKKKKNKYLLNKYTIRIHVIIKIIIMLCNTINYNLLKCILQLTDMYIYSQQCVNYHF